MPNQPKTPLLTARVPQEDLDWLRERADAEARTVTELVREAITDLRAKRGLDKV